MVNNIDIPRPLAASPSSLSGTPYLTINRETAFDLDSSNAFEGPEKLLEVWFAPSAHTLSSRTHSNGLKSVSIEKWTEMLDLVHCKILSVINSDDVDAYLLSESSMFVFPHKLVLKTCGTTTLLLGLPRILEIAAEAGFNLATGCQAATQRVFYSRKNFSFPEQQQGPHRSWRNEVKELDRLFQRGSAYTIGKMNGEHWYLYITQPGNEFLLPPSINGMLVDTATEPSGKPLANDDDETLEILMTDLDEEKARQFYFDDAVSAAAERPEKYRDAQDVSRNALESTTDGVTLHSADSGLDVFEQMSFDHGASPAEKAKHEEGITTQGHALGTIISNLSGLSSVYPQERYPDARIDAYLFTPCGFSANGVVPASIFNDKVQSTHYFTVHVTPEPQCSFASFETNVPSRQKGRETGEIIEHVVDIFRPGRFSVTLFEAKSANRIALSAAGAGLRNDTVRGYRRVERIVHDLDGYDLVFRYYERLDWVGGEPRLGEEAD